MFFARSISAQTETKGWKINHTFSVLYNKYGNDLTRYRLSGGQGIFTNISEVSYHINALEIGAFLGRSRGVKRPSFLFGHRFANYGISACLKPKKLVFFKRDGLRPDILQLFLRTEIHVYNAVRTTSNEHKYIFGIGPGFRVNLTSRWSLEYNYIFNTYNENRFGLNYFIRR